MRKRPLTEEFCFLIALLTVNEKPPEIGTERTQTHRSYVYIIQEFLCRRIEGGF